ncbi:hypothetical protein AQJ66_26860 [Streptomyces bungoensis]|uniref:Uncharacterized protein n=1 Tax=Streptomyces bungoensis TaxID=285568 RepID=A0A101SUW7_9ACTN|nr:hypothetical protein [Streptomyces bungoensis]KUN80359.1 hypothetical protein AQJ66_26860 [Streptomyces bungoensis]
MTAYDLPADLEATVVGLLYQRAAELDWLHLTDIERTNYYASWTEDPQIGGKLLLFIKKPDAVRVWMKNGPMKEYSRALNGVGKYAQFVDQRRTDVQTLITKALGPEWLVVPDTQKIKPLRLTVRRNDNEDDERRFCWGPSRDLKHLVWRAISDQVEGDTTPWVICVVSPFTRPAANSERAQHQRLATRLGLEIIDVTH